MIVSGVHSRRFHIGITNERHPRALVFDECKF